MSRPIQPTGTSRPSSTRCSASAAKRSAITRSLGSSRRALGLPGPAAKLAAAALAVAALRGGGTSGGGATSGSGARGGGTRSGRLGHLGEDVAGVRDVLGVAQRLPDGVIPGGEEGEAHRAADQDRVGDPQEAIDHRDLVGDLGAAEDRDERPGRPLQHAHERAHLAFEQAPGGVGQQVRHAGGARVGAVGGAEGVVDVDVREFSQGAREVGVVAGLPRLEADVLEDQQLTVAQPLGERAHVLAHDVRGERDAGAGQQLAQARGHGRERETGNAPALGAVQVGDQHEPCAAGAQLFDRRQRRADAGVVGDLDRPLGADGERDVEVHAHQHLPAPHLQIVESPHACPLPA